MNKYVYEEQLKSAAYKDASEFAPSSHSHAAIDTLEKVVENKVDKSQITSLQSELDTHEVDSVKHIPTCSAQDDGKFLKVINGTPTWTTVPNAEEASF